MPDPSSADDAPSTPASTTDETDSTTDETPTPPVHLGADGRPSGMPTPPGAELIDGDPVTTTDSKRVMIRAECDDTIEIQQIVHGLSRVPTEYTVVKRTDTYYGPRLLLAATVNGETQNYLLTCPGPNSQLILWQSNSGMESKSRNGWLPIAEVKACIADTRQYRICEVCDRPVRSRWHKRLRAAGACEQVADDDLTVDI